MTTDLALTVIPVERQGWFINLVDECKDIVTETEFTSRWALVEGYHSLGSRILQENENFDRAKIYGEGICNAVAESLGKQPRTIYYAIQFAREYPDLNLLPEAKNTSWHHIINKYLTDGTKKKVVKKADLYRMIKEIRELLEHERLEAIQINNDEVFLHDRGAERIAGYFRYLQDQVNKITDGLE